jgi:hypothetical protein
MVNGNVFGKVRGLPLGAVRRDGDDQLFLVFGESYD